MGGGMGEGGIIKAHRVFGIIYLKHPEQFQRLDACL